MTERELFKRAVSENFLDKDAIFAHALGSVPVPRPVSGGTRMKKRFSALLIAAVALLCDFLLGRLEHYLKKKWRLEQ